MQDYTDKLAVRALNESFDDNLGGNSSSFGIAWFQIMQTVSCALIYAAFCYVVSSNLKREAGEERGSGYGVSYRSLTKLLALPLVLPWAILPTSRMRDIYI